MEQVRNVASEASWVARLLSEQGTVGSSLIGGLQLPWTSCLGDGLGCVSVFLCPSFPPWLDLLMVLVHQRYSACIGFPPLSCRPEASPGGSCPQPPETHHVLQGEVWRYTEHCFRTLSCIQRGLCRCELRGVVLPGLCGGCLPL